MFLIFAKLAPSLSEVSVQQRHKEHQGFSGCLGVCLAGIVADRTFLLISVVSRIARELNLQAEEILELPIVQIARESSMQMFGSMFAINLLLGASNYTMQCLISPKRTDFDVAYSKTNYVDDRLLSLRNLRGRKRKTLFGLLVISSLPLHLK